MPLTLALEKQRQANLCETEAGLVYITSSRPYLKLMKYFFLKKKKNYNSCFLYLGYYRLFKIHMLNMIINAK